MNNIKYILILIIILSKISNGSAQNNTVVGNWINIEKNDTTILKLTEDSVYYLYFVEDGDTLGGINSYYIDESYGDDSVFLDHKYSVNTTVYPHRLTLTAYYSGTDSINFILALVFEFRNNNTLAVVACDEGIFIKDGDDPEKILKEFYTATPKIDKTEFEVIELKPLK